MSKPAEQQERVQMATQNRKARHEFSILETWEAGIVLQGTEVKSLRDGKGNLTDAFARIHNGELWLYEMHISPYEQGNRYNHGPRRPRKLLMHRSELRRLVGKVEEKGLTLVPLDVHFSRGLAKVTLALARGKKLHDKRDSLREKELERDTQRALKGDD